MRTHRGASLLLALAVVASLLAVLAFAAADQRLAIMAESNRMQERRALVAAQSGIQWALQDLATANTASVTLQDDWATITTNGDEKYTVADTSFRVQIVDAASLININTVTEAQLQTMGLTQEQIDSLLDWRSAGQTPRPEGAKDAYYNALTYPYNTKLRAFDSVDELLQVKGFNAATLFNTAAENNTVTVNTNGTPDLPPLADVSTVDSVSPSTSATGTAKLNANTATAVTMVQRGIPATVAARILAGRARGTYANMAALLRAPGITLADCGPILENLQIGTATTATGMLNLNTTSEAVLNTLPGLTPDVVSAIITLQQSGFTSMSDLATIPGMSLSALQQIADHVAVGSNVFLVRCVGTAGQASVALEAAVKITNGQPTVTRISRCLFTDMPTRWSWETTTTNENVLVESK